MSHSQHLRRVSREYVIDLYLRPPVTKYRLMDYMHIERIVTSANRCAWQLLCLCVLHAAGVCLPRRPQVGQTPPLPCCIRQHQPAGVQLARCLLCCQHGALCAHRAHRDQRQKVHLLWDVFKSC